MTFQDGNVKQYDMSILFDKYPQLKALENRDLFLSGRMMGMYGVIWNDDLDIEAETIYEDGVTIRKDIPAENSDVGDALLKARAKKGLTQKELASAAGINQADISKIEKGVANPTVATLTKIAEKHTETLISGYTHTQHAQPVILFQSPSPRIHRTSQLFHSS